MEQYFTYILKSLSDGKFYYGHTSNLEERLSTHNKGKVRSTKGRIPLEVYYFETYKTKSEAAKRETFLNLLKVINGFGKM